MSCSALAASQGGALTQLIALGAADKYLTQNASITFWRFRYNKYTNFACEAIEQPFQSQVMFGADTQLTFNRTGDLIYWTYVVVDLPGLHICDSNSSVGNCTNANGGSQSLFTQSYPGLSADGLCDPCNDRATDDTVLFEHCCASDEPKTPWVNWTNAIGQFIISRASLVIGGQVIDTLYSDYLYMWEELSGKPGRRLEEMIGKELQHCHLVTESQQTRRLYVPLPFFFTQSSGNALPVVSLQFHGIQLHVCFADLKKCIQTSCPDGQQSALVLKKKTMSPLVDQDLRALVETTYVYLDIEERDRFASGSFEQLITQVQAYTICTQSCQVRMSLNFNHPIIELIWGVRRKCMENVNNWGCYAGRDLQDPIKTVHLKLNNLPRFAPKEGRYFRLVQPYQHHSCIPNSFVYVWSAALHPEEAQPSGSVNFSRIDNVELVFEMQDRLTEPSQMQNCGGDIKCNNGDFTAIVFARSWNILRYREGLGGLAYSN